ncbi:MFS transporter [Actinoplanes subtropicus]|uniref:MFS transporter n=1 Tax=Actinoplanes subtropicus TaxID=543632 RepID=UPI000AC1C3D0|nr:MFS transporter [Actinoplanes subtropicus]
MSHLSKPSTDRRAITLAMSCLGVFIAYLPITTVAISLPAIQEAMHTSTAQLAWVQDAFVLPLAAFVLTAGVFGDVHGRKKVFSAGLLLAAAGAAVALCATTIQVLWAGQVLAGLGSAALLPTTLALISHAVPDPRERGKFIGLWAMALLAALAVGPVIAGVILDHAAWRWIYLLPIPAALLALAAAARLLPDSHAAHGRRLDWPGQLTATLAITALVYGVIEGGAGSFTDARVLIALALGAIALVGFVLIERRSTSPMLNLALFRSPAFTATALVALISFLALIGFFFALSLYFGMVQQLDTLHAAARLILVPLAAIAAGGPVGRLMHRVPARHLITGGLLVITAALALLTTLDTDTSFVSAGWRLVLLGVGMGVVMTPMTAVAVGAVPRSLAGMASAGNNAFRQIGSALGPAVLGTLLSAKATATLGAHLTASGVTGSLHRQVVATADASGLGAVAHLSLGASAGQVYAALGDSLLDGLRLCLVVAAVLNAVAAACALILLREPRTTVATATATRHDHPAETVSAGAPGKEG